MESLEEEESEAELTDISRREKDMSLFIDFEIEFSKTSLCNITHFLTSLMLRLKHLNNFMSKQQLQYYFD